MNKAPSVQTSDAQHLVVNWSTGETLDCDLTDTIKRHTAIDEITSSLCLLLLMRKCVRKCGVRLDFLPF